MSEENDNIAKVTSASRGEIEQYASALKMLTTDTKNLKVAQKALVLSAKEHYEAYKNIEDTAKSLADIQNEISAKAEELAKAKKESAKIDQLRFKTELDSLKTSKKRLDAAHNIYKSERGTLDAKVKIVDALKIELKSREKILGVELKLRRMKNKAKVEGADEKDFVDTLQDSLIGGAMSALKMAQNLNNLSAETVAFSLLIPELGVEQFGDKYVNFAKTTDDSFKRIMKAGISFSKSGYEEYLSALDPIGNALSDFKFISKDFQDEMITNTNLVGEDMTSAFVAAKNNISLFRRDLIGTSEESRANAAATLNLIANVNKLGVAHEDTAKTIDFFTRALKQTPKQARESVRSLSI